jgi:hypothetical protein
VLYELTAFDAEFTPVFGPQLGPSPPVDNRELTALGQRNLNADRDNTAEDPKDKEEQATNGTRRGEMSDTSSAAPLPSSSAHTTPQPGLSLYDPAHPTSDDNSTNPVVIDGAAMHEERRTNTTSNDDPDPSLLPPLLRALTVDSTNSAAS